MLDFDASKLLIIGVVALVVIGPKDLPRVLRQVGQMVGKLRRMAGEFQGQFMDAMKEADLQDLRDEVAKLKNTASLDVDFHPVRDATAELSKAMDGVATPMGGVSGRGQKDFNFTPTPAPATNLVGTGIAPVAEAPLMEPPADVMVMNRAAGRRRPARARCDPCRDGGGGRAGRTNRNTVVAPEGQDTEAAAPR